MVNLSSSNFKKKKRNSLLCPKKIKWCPSRQGKVSIHRELTFHIFYQSLSPSSIAWCKYGGDTKMGDQMTFLFLTWEFKSLGVGCRPPCHQPQILCSFPKNRMWWGRLLTKDMTSTKKEWSHSSTKEKLSWTTAMWHVDGPAGNSNLKRRLWISCLRQIGSIEHSSNKTKV